MRTYLLQSQRVKVTSVRKIPTCYDVLSADEPTLALPDTTDLTGVTVTRIHALLQGGRLIAVHRDGIAQIPTHFFEDDEAARSVFGALVLLADGGYTRKETLEWLFTEDESLPERPVDALHGHPAHEVVRHAQIMAL